MRILVHRKECVIVTYVYVQDIYIYINNKGSLQRRGEINDGCVLSLFRVFTLVFLSGTRRGNEEEIHPWRGVKLVVARLRDILVNSG